MSYNIKVKNGMAFNLDDPFQKKQYDHICKMPNVSGYLKRLVAMDMVGNWQPSATQKQEEVEMIEVNEDMMLGLL